MKFDKMTPQELAGSLQSFKGGICKFEVLSAEDTTSKSGNEMIKVKLNCTNTEGSTGSVYDYLLGSIKWKLAQFFATIGEVEMAKSGDISPQQLVGKKGYCKCEKDGDYFKVKRFISEEDYKEAKLDESQSMRPVQDDVPFNDDIPF